MKHLKLPMSFLKRAMLPILFLVVSLFIFESCSKKDIPSDPARQIEDPGNGTNTGSEDSNSNNSGEVDPSLSKIINIEAIKEISALTITWDYEGGDDVDKVKISYEDPAKEDTQKKTVDKGVDKLEVALSGSSYNKEFVFELTPIGTSGKSGTKQTFKTTVKPILGVKDPEDVVLTVDNLDPNTPVRNGDFKQYVVDSHVFLLSEFGTGVDYDFGDDWNRFETSSDLESFPINFDIHLDDGLSSFQVWYLPTARGDIPRGMPREIKIFYSEDGQNWELFQEVHEGLPFPHPDNPRRADRWFSDFYADQTGAPNVKHIRFQVLSIFNKDGTPAAEESVLFNLSQFGIKTGNVEVIEVE